MVLAKNHRVKLELGRRHVLVRLQAGGGGGRRRNRRSARSDIIVRSSGELELGVIVLVGYGWGWCYRRRRRARPWLPLMISTLSSQSLTAGADGCVVVPGKYQWQLPSLSGHVTLFVPMYWVPNFPPFSTCRGCTSKVICGTQNLIQSSDKTRRRLD